MSVDKINNVTYLPTAQGIGENADPVAPTSDSADLFGRELGELQAGTDATNTLPETENPESSTATSATRATDLSALLSRQTIFTDATPAVRDQLFRVEASLMDSVPNGLTTLNITIEVAAVVRLDVANQRLLINTGDDVMPAWQGIDELSRDQVPRAANVVVDAFDPEAADPETHVSDTRVSDAVRRQIGNGDSLLVTSNGEFQLHHYDESQRLTELRVLEANGSLISTSQFEADGSHHYREYFDDGTAGLEIHYGDNQQIQRVDYFGTDGRVTTREYYDATGTVSHSEYLDGDGRVHHTEFF